MKNSVITPNVSSSPMATAETAQKPGDNLQPKAQTDRAGQPFGAAPLLGNYFKLSNKLINLKNLNYIEKDQQHEIYKMYFKDGLVAPLTAEEFQTMKGSNPVQTPFFCPLSEEVPALLTAREVVLRPEAVQRFGHSYCNSILKGCAYVA